MARLADRYELGEVLGTGGMAQVVAGFDHVLERPVAIKLIREELLQDGASRERLLREARGAARLQHPNAVAVYDVVESEGVPSIVMELVDGPTLSAVLEEGPLPPERAFEILGQSLAGLAAAHARGLVHRDVKPNNILLPAAGGAKLADFGIAHVLSESQTRLTATGQVLGTPRYLSPEQASGHPATPASDVYAIGVVAFECFAGRPLFGAQTPIALALAHQVAEVPPLPPEVDPAVAAVVMRALSKDPADRYTDAGEMLRAWRSEPGVLPAAVKPPSTVAAPTVAAPTVVVGRDDTAVLGASSDPTQVSAVDGPAPMPPPPATGDAAGEPSRGGTRAWVLAALVGAIALVLLVAFAFNGGEDDDPAQGPGDAEVGGVVDDPETEVTEPPGESEPPDENGDAEPDPPAEEPDPELAEEPVEAPADEVPEEPSGGSDSGSADSLATLISGLRADPGAAGEKHDDLLEDLEEIEGHRSENRRRDLSRERIVDLAEWLSKGEIESDAGQRAIGLLDPIARPEDPQLADAHALFVEVARTLPQWGEKGEDVLDDLEDLLQERSGPSIAQAARELIDEIDEWIAEGELDRQRGEEAVRVLSPLAED